jgi:hypothetical protein
MYEEAPDRTQKENHDGDETRTSGEGSGETQYIKRDQTAQADEHQIYRWARVLTVEML